MELAQRVKAVKPSSTVAVASRARELRAAGEDVLSFAAGEPDFDTPQAIKQAAIDALQAGQTKYVATLGDPKTREVIASKLVGENAIPGLSADHVAICVGGKHALYMVAQCLFDAGEPWEAVIPTPAWVSYAPIVELAGGRVVEVSTTPESGFCATPEQIDAAITPRTKLLILNSPSNPCGTMYSEAQLRGIADVVANAARSRAPNVMIASDEIYEKIVYGGTPHFSIGAVPEVAERTITLNGMSKAYAMTGWRAGYAAIPGDFGAGLIKAMGKLQGQMTTNITSFVYPAIRTALTSCADDVERMRGAFAQRAELTFGLLNAIPGVRVNRPVGAFYAFPDVTACFGKTSPTGATISTAQSFAEALLNEAKIALVPGEDFGGCGAQHVRFSFACAEEQIREGLRRFAQFVESLG